MSRAKNRSEARRQLRRRLEKMGCPPSEIERVVAQRESIAANRFQAQKHLQRHDEQEDRLSDALKNPPPPVESPDDSRYRPTRYDPLLTGVARATGETAKAIRRGKTATDWQIAERAEM